LLSIIAEKVHKEKAQQDKLKEVKACLNFKVCLGKSSKIQEVSQHSESRTPDVRGDLMRRLRSRRSHSMSRSPEPTPGVFSRIRRDISESHINRLGIKEERKEVCSKGWRHVKGASEYMRISGFMHEITNPELIKRLHDEILKSVGEMMRITTTFLKGEVAASNQVRKKTLPAWKQQEAARKQNFDRRGDFRNQQRELGHNTDECMHLKTQIEELIKTGKLSYVIKGLKQGSEKDQPKAAKKGEAFGKNKATAILMVQPWQRVSRKRITQSFSPDPEISFPPLGDGDRAKVPMIIKAGMRGHFIHPIYVDGGSASEILYEHCFNRMCPEVKSQMVPATTPLIVLGGILTLRSSKIIPRECMMVSGPEVQPSASTQVACNLDVCAWKPMDMTGVPRHIAEHRLNVREGCPLVRHKKRSQAPKRNMTIQEEVKRLVKADIMKEVHYHSWLSNLVYVDDLVIKSRTEHEIIRDIEETFRTLREINMKLNPKKYTFRVEEDFIMERPEDDSLAAPMEVEEELPDPWTLFTDESSCIDGSGAGLILTDPKGTKFTYALRFRFDATNNEAESKEPGMIQYLEKVKMLASSFKKFSIKQVPRSKDKKADTLSKITSTSFAHLTKQVLVEELKEKSINKAEVLAIVEDE
nr:hypothetical protein [Tanacetum cinerariifolium]